MKRILTTFTLLLALGPVRAENLVDVFSLAVNNDPALLAAQAELEAAKEANPQAWSNWLPQISIDGKYGKGSQLLQGGALVFDDELGRYQFDNVWYQANVRQPLFNLPAYYELKMADAIALKAQMNYRLAQQGLIHRVIRSYFNVLSMRGRLEFARAEKGAIAHQLRQTRQRYEAGIIAITDVHEAQARHDLAIAAEVRAENELAHAKELLREITGSIQTRLLSLKVNAPLTPPTPTNINAWTEAARNQNLELAAARVDARIAKESINQHKAEYYPSVDFNASYGKYTDGRIYGTQSIESVLSIDFNMPLYNGGITSSKVRQARFKAKSAEERVREVEGRVISETRNAYLGVLAGMSYVKALNQALESSMAALKATEAGFEVGTRSAIEVLDAQRELYRTQRDYADVRYQYITDMMRLKMSVGLLTVDDLEIANGWLL